MDYNAKTLWMGNIETHMDEPYLRNFFGEEGYSAIRLMRDKQTGVPAGYAFVDFPSHHQAKQFLEKYNGRPMPGSKGAFRLNWAQYSTSRSTAGPEYSLFVGDIASEVTEDIILKAFRVKFPSCTSMKIVMDPTSGYSKGYGFIKFSNQAEADLAAEDMQGVYIGSKPIRISKAAYSAAKNKPMEEMTQPLNRQQHQQHYQNHNQNLHQQHHPNSSTNVNWNQYPTQQQQPQEVYNPNYAMDPQAMAAYQQHQNAYSLFTVENQYPGTTDINFFVKAHDIQSDNRNFVNARVNTFNSELSSSSWAQVQMRGLK